MPRLALRDLRKAFGPTPALAGVDLVAHAGEVHALLGENGAGKSTLVALLSGAIRPDAGEMEIDGAPYHPHTPADARAAGVAVVHQQLSLCPHLTVAENIVLGTEPTRFGVISRSAIRARAREALERVSPGRIDPDVGVGELATADRQLVEIARALSQERCRVLLLDEPTSSATSDDVERLFAAVRALRGQGLAVLFISHFLEEVKALADRFTVLRDGRAVATGLTADVSTGEMTHAMIGRGIEQLFPRTARTAGDVVLEVRGLAGVEKPVDVTFDLRRGEVLGIAGLVGAGRTELLDAVFGLAPVRRGTVRVGAFSGPASPLRRLAQGVGMLVEDRARDGLALSLSITDNVTLSKSPGFVIPSRQRAAAARWIDALRIRCKGPDQSVRDLSGGNQQKVALARLLHHDVDVFLLDEPTRGIDVGSKAEIYTLIDRLAAAGKAILVVSSTLPELLGVADRIAVMRRGRLGPARAVDEWTEHTLLEEATLGT